MTSAAHRDHRQSVARNRPAADAPGAAAPAGAVSPAADLGVGAGDLAVVTGSPLRTSVFLALVPSARRHAEVSAAARCTPQEADATLLALERAGVAEDGAGVWSLTRRGRELHDAYVASPGRFRRP